MHKIAGYLIKYYRLQQNISQEGLCKGICVVSYLSKIEQGIVNPSDEIIHQLFRNLSLTYHDDYAFINCYEAKIATYFEKLYFQEDTSGEATDILQVLDELMCSPLMMETLLWKVNHLIHNEKNYQAYQLEIEKVAVFVPYMNDEQLFLYHMQYAYHNNIAKEIEHLKKAGRIKEFSVQKFQLAYAYYHEGLHAQANEVLYQAYNLAAQEGNVAVMMDTALFLGNSFSSIRDDALMVKYYQLSTKIARVLKREDIVSIIEYNLGSTYLEWGMFEQAKQHLLSSIQHQSHANLFLNYQKLALLYREYENYDQVDYYLKLADEEQLKNQDSFMQKMNEFVHLYCQRERTYNEVYMKLLEELTGTKDGKALGNFSLSPISYSFRNFHVQYLMDAYKHMRRYKEALQLKELLENSTFSYKTK